MMTEAEIQTQVLEGISNGLVKLREEIVALREVLETPPEPAGAANPLDALVDDATLATLLKTNRQRLAALRSDGLPHIRVGRRKLYVEAEVYQWLLDNARGIKTSHKSTITEEK